MIKVLHTLPLLGRDGTSSFVLNYYRHIDKKQIKFDFICLKIDDQKLVQQLRKQGVQVFEFPLSSIKLFIASIVKIFLFFFRYRKQYQIIHCHQMGLGFSFLFFAWLFRIPVRIAHSHSSIYSTKKVVGFLQYALTRVFYLFATHYCGCSNLAGNFLFGPRKWKNCGNLFRNAIECERYEFSREKRATIRNEFCISDDCKVILFAGAIHPIKNPFFMLNVFERFLDIEKNAKLIVCGRDLTNGQFENYLKKKELKDNVIYLGPRRDLDKIYSAADLFLLPSLAEGLPFVIIETQAAGLPALISSKITEEVIILNSTVRFALEAGPDKWAEQIKKMLSLYQERNGDAQEKLYSAGYNIKNAKKELEFFYLRLVKHALEK